MGTESAEDRVVAGMDRIERLSNVILVLDVAILVVAVQDLDTTHAKLLGFEIPMPWAGLFATGTQIALLLRLRSVATWMANTCDELAEKAVDRIVARLADHQGLSPVASQRDGDGRRRPTATVFAQGLLMVYGAALPATLFLRQEWAALNEPVTNGHWVAEVMANIGKALALSDDTPTKAPSLDPVTFRELMRSEWGLAGAICATLGFLTLLSAAWAIVGLRSRVHESAPTKTQTLTFLTLASPACVLIAANIVLGVSGAFDRWSGG